MKKKLTISLILFALLFLNINDLKAVTSSGNSCDITISKNGKYDPVGSVYTTYKSVKEYTEDVQGSGTIEYYSGFVAASKRCSQEGIRCTSSSPFYSSKYSYYPYDYGRIYYLMYSSLKECNAAKSKSSVYSSGYCHRIYYVYTYKTETHTETKTKWKYIPVKGNQYATESGDPAYCIQPGNKFGSKYQINEEFDLASCKDSIKGDYRCGLAYMLMKNVDYNKETGQYTTKEEYAYGEMLTALRMWTAYKGGLSGVDSFGNEDDQGIDGDIATTNFYSITATRAAAGYTGIECPADAKASDMVGVICTKDGSAYTRSIALFNETLSTSSGVEIPGGGIIDIKTEKIDGTQNAVPIEVDYPIEFACTDANDPECDITYTMEIYDEDGILVEKFESKDKNSNVTCKADNSKKTYYCTYKVDGKKYCLRNTSLITTTWTIKITVKGWTPGGLIKQYVPCKEGYQIMMSIDFNKKDTESEKEEPDYTQDQDVQLDCQKKDCEAQNKCPSSEMVVKSDTPRNCQDRKEGDSAEEYDGYSNGTKQDPYMNCILNACVESEKQLFNKTKDYINYSQDTCQIFCREEIDFYMANKTLVYTGMQFRYQIEVPLIRDGKIKNKLQESGDNKLTSVVLQKRQCTTEVYYDKWLNAYEEKTIAMVKAWDEWKKWEALKNHGYDIKKGSATVGGSSTGCDSCGISGGTYITREKFIWPKTPSPYNYTNINANKDNRATFKIPDPKVNNPSYSDGVFPTNHSNSVNPDTCNVPYTDKYGNTDYYSVPCGCSSCSFDPGTEGSNATDVVAIKERNAAKAYEEAVLAVAQLIYDLQNCNLYVDKSVSSKIDLSSFEDIQYPYASYKNKISKASNNSSKLTILLDSACKDKDISKCIELEIGYEDDKYGNFNNPVTFDKAIDIVSSNENLNYYCKDSDKDGKRPDPNSRTCYVYVSNSPNEQKMSNNTKTHHYVTCKGEETSAYCKTNNIALPTNDFSTFLAVTQAEFWQPKKYSVQNFTGLVSEGTGDNKTSVSLGQNVFPVSNNNTSGITNDYDIKYKYSNVGQYSFTKLSEYNYSCIYEAYNTTTMYDCDNRYDKDGKLMIDESECKGEYNVDDTVPIIDGPSWDGNGKSKKYGFVYRNVNLNNLFPSGTKDNVTGRPLINNWSQASDIIEQIQESANQLYISDKYLSYSFTLTPTAINKIREYNRGKNSGGLGYLDNSLIDCSASTEGFYGCKSEFLNNFLDGSNNSYGITVNKFRNHENNWNWGGN